MSQIVSSMRHRKSAYSSLVLEVALGCTVVAYSLGLGDGLRSTAAHPLGFDLTRTFTVTFEGPVSPREGDRSARELARLRALAGVEAAAWVDLPPLSRCELPESVMTPGGPYLAWTLHGDSELPRALGAHLAEGRWLDARDQEPGGPTPVLITRALANKLGAAAVGTSLSSAGFGSMTVVGVVEDEIRLGPFYSLDAQLVLVPEHPMPTRRTSYLVRARPEASATFLRQAREALARDAGADTHIRVEVQSFTEHRRQFVRNVGGAESIILITVFGMILVVLVGSIGMASSLIVERRRQIGIRRALGARRSDIIAYFMLENLFATVLGILIGAGCCVLLDQFLTPFRTNTSVAWREYLPLSGALFVVAGQLSVWLPAKRAACGAPCVVARAA